MAREFPDREAKLDLAYQILAAGGSGYAANLACRQQFGSGIGHTDICRLRAGLTEQGRKEVKEPVTRMALPPEMLEDSPEVLLGSTDLALPVPAPNGTSGQFRQIQAWMSRVQAEQVILTKDGKLSVLAWHQFDLGRQDP